MNRLFKYILLLASVVCNFSCEKEIDLNEYTVTKIYYRTSDDKPITQSSSWNREFDSQILADSYSADNGGCLLVYGKVTTFDAWFHFCSTLTEINIPSGIKYISEGAVSFCSRLTSVTIPNSVTTIGRLAFKSCYGLTSVTIGDSATTIGEYAFGDCDSLTEFNGKFASEDGRCLIVDGTLNSFAPAGLVSYTIPDSVTTIGRSAFRDCDSLTSVTIPDSVTTIEGSAFNYCESLTSVTIPDSVTTIGEKAFYRCSNLTNVTIGDSVTTIGDYAFKYCSSLTSVTIPDSVMTIGEDAFYYCDSLTSVTIPDSVTTIVRGAFQYCDSLTSVTIGDSVTTIGSWAFFNCASLTRVYCTAAVPPSLGSDVFYSNGSGRKIYVPSQSIKAYKSADGWKEYANSIIGYDF